MKVPFLGLIGEVYVLVVDQEKEFITDQLVDLLQFYEYKVTTVTVSAAMSMLSKGKKKIDVMIINVNSSDSHYFELLAQAVALNIISLFVCDENNKLLTMNALENGAYLCLKKPLEEEIVKHLWQFVLRNKIQMEKSIKGLEVNGRDLMNDDDNNIVTSEEQAGEKNMPVDTEGQSNNIHKAENDVVSNDKYKFRRKRGRKSTKEINERKSHSSVINKTGARKNCVKWTVDLHVKFTEAMEQLGEGRCYPANIVKVMNMPNLSRKQIASHLQKCRDNNWRPQKERKYTRHESLSDSQQRSSYNTSLEKKKRRNCEKFGRMPRLQTNVPNQTQRVPRFPPVNTNNVFAISTQQQLYHPQLQVQSHYLNPSLLAQNDAGGGLQQHDLLFGMLGSENPNIGSTNYRSSMVFNSGDHHNYSLDHHTQNDYGLDLNPTRVTTYSGNAIKSDIDVGNATINVLGAANANFQQHVGEQNMFDPSNIVVASDANDIQENNSNEWENCDIYFNFDHMDDLFQNPRSPSATLPNEHGSGRDTECPDFKNSKFPDE